MGRENTNVSIGTGLANSASKVKDNVYAGFLQYGMAIDQSTSLNVGVRYEHAYFDYKDILEGVDNLNRMTATGGRRLEFDESHYFTSCEKLIS